MTSILLCSEAKVGWMVYSISWVLFSAISQSSGSICNGCGPCEEEEEVEREEGDKLLWRFPISRLWDRCFSSRKSSLRALTKAMPHWKFQIWLQINQYCKTLDKKSQNGFFLLFCFALLLRLTSKSFLSSLLLLLHSCMQYKRHIISVQSLKHRKSFYTTTGQAPAPDLSVPWLKPRLRQPLNH